MLRPHHFILLVALLADGGIVTPQPTPAGPDAGPVLLQPRSAESIRWPNEERPVVVMDGPAVLAAHAALQDLLTRYAKDYPGACEYSATAMEVIVSKADGLYFVRIDHHVDRCGGGRTCISR
jgi:hypothetical protein